MNDHDLNPLHISWSTRAVALLALACGATWLPGCGDAGAPGDEESARAAVIAEHPEWEGLTDEEIAAQEEGR